MATQLESTAKFLVKTFKELKPTSDFIMLENNNTYQFSTFQELRNHARKYKMKNF